MASSDLSGCLLFVCNRHNGNVTRNLCHPYAFVPERERGMTGENVKSRMFIILLAHGHRSRSLAQRVGMSGKKYTHCLNVKEVGTSEMLGSIEWRGGVSGVEYLVQK